MKSVTQIRRDRLADLVTECGSAANLARRVGKDRRQISAWLNYKDMRDSTAREIEHACLKPLGWLDNETDRSQTASPQPGLPSQSARTSRSKMADAIELLRHLADLRGVPGLVSDPEAISIAYDFLMEFDTPIDGSNVLDITKQLAAALRGEGDEGERSSAA